MKPVKQHLASDCAAACLAYVARHHGRAVTTAAARRLAGTTAAGTTALGLVDGAGRLGLAAKGLRGGPGLLAACPLPAVAHVRTDSGQDHFVVLEGRRGNRLRIMDPARGRKSWQAADSFAASWQGVAVVMSPAADFERRDEAPTPAARLGGLLLGHGAELAQIVLGALGLSLLGLAMSFYVQHLVDDVIPAGNRALLQLLGVAMLALLLFRLVLAWFQFIFSARLAQRLDAALILGYYRHLLRLPQGFLDSMRVGEMISRINDAVQIRSFLSSVLVGLVLNPVVFALSFGAMCVCSPRLALLSLVQVPLQAGLCLWVNILNRRYLRTMRERSADLNSHLTESLHLASTLKRFGLEPAAAARAEARFVRLLRTSWRWGIAGFWCSSSAALMGQLYALGMLWYGTSLVLGGRLTAGELMSCYTLALYAAGALSGLVALSSDLQQALIAADRLFEIMDESPEPEGGDVALTPDLLGDIAFESVTVRHAGRLPALREVTLRLPRGRFTAIVGESGSGKSTLFALLQRLYRPESGRISIGKIDIDYVGTASLRDTVCALPQRVELASGSILENIAAGAASPDLSRIADLCAELGILEFINGLPQKFDTALAEGGLSLSAGQRQRIAIVRTLYRQAPIVLLDEPTNALDWDSVRRLAALIGRLRDEGTTVVAATHGRSLLRLADQVVELKDGRARTRERTAAPAASAAIPPAMAVVAAPL